MTHEHFTQEEGGSIPTRNVDGHEGRFAIDAVVSYHVDTWRDDEVVGDAVLVD